MEKFKVSDVKKYIKAIVTIEYNGETYQVAIEEKSNGNNIVDAIDCNTNEFIEDSDLEQELIEFAYQNIKTI